MKKTLEGFKDKKFLITILTLILPIALQNLISSSLNMVDNVMIGKLGESSIAAVGLVNQYFFIFMLCLSGINAGAGIFISQFWGRKDTRNIRRMLGLEILLSIFAAVLFGVVAFLSPESIIKIFTNNAEVITLGSSYIKVISITFLITAISMAYSTALRCMGIAKAPMYGSLIGVLTNAFLNWVLIFGNLGFTARGVVGAAIATSIARTIEMVYILVVSYKSNEVIRCRVKEMFSFNKGFIASYFKTSSSVIINELIWSLGVSTYSIIYARIGIREVASMQIASTVNNMFMVLGIGLATAGAIIVGNKIGEEKTDEALDYAKRLGVLAPLVGLISGVALYIGAPYIVKIFNIDESTVRMTIDVLKIMAVFAPLRFFNVLMIVGVFRGGGDTTYSMLVQLGTIWFFAIPIGFLGAVYFKLTLPTVVFLLCSEEIVKVVFELKRLRSGKWMKNIASSLEKEKPINNTMVTDVN
ncbi:MATE family efflux transporter [Tissierella creatinophila]|uniref:Multidrug resistance protein NorM n=1 Tax=Tissierella creatinophila DSM 6911 TaxID=1123403 RepID=A0A1U7M2S9_TISCR|nr:MATE family efflux transporter [Tissierella creatinophila]OLS01498.1 multidrug resistance protein NorM [Tissierella creatinophila DSM 6911]